MRAFVWKHESASHRIRICTETRKRNCAGQERHGCGSPVLWKAADADFLKSTEAGWPAGMNTLDCSPMVRNGLSSWFLRGTKLATAKHSLAAAIRTVRKARGLSQEAFSDVSSRTYMSTLERDLKSPTIHKLAELCEVMEVHPLTLLTLAYVGRDPLNADQLLAQVQRELKEIVAASKIENS